MFFVWQKNIKKAGGSKLYLPDIIEVDINFYKCLYCSKYTLKNVQREKYFFDTYKNGKYADMYINAIKVPIISSWEIHKLLYEVKIS